MRAIASFDDGTVDDLRIAELVEKYDIYAIFYFPVHSQLVNEPKGRQSLNSSQRKEIAINHEIGSHTVNHPLLTRIPIKQAYDEIFLSKQLLEEEFDTNITTFAYPRGYANPEIQNLVKEAGYQNARGVNVGYIHESENQFYTQPSVHVACQRKEYGGQKWLDYALNLLEEAIRTPDSVYHLFGHSWEISQNDGWHDLEELLKRVSHENSHS